jgi:hypothetical protein
MIQSSAIEELKYGGMEYVDGYEIADVFILSHIYISA